MQNPGPRQESLRARGRSRLAAMTTEAVTCTLGVQQGRLRLDGIRFGWVKSRDNTHISPKGLKSQTQQGAG